MKAENSIDYATILRDAGYKLSDRGHFWQTSAVFRDGDNPTAISIFKDSGVWTDFVEGGRALPFEVLLKKTFKTDNVDYILKNNSFNFSRHTRELLKEEKTFSKEALKKLLPDYSFYEKRGITEATQKKYNCGLATGGKLYRRIVFPIFREDDQIHGFSGRWVLDGNSVKWLHYGKAADWFYPYFSVEGVKQKAQEQKRLFVVESIGDSMALFEEGVKNNIVAFSNNLTPRLISRLISKDCDIVLSFNNDEDQNRGFDGALSSILKLIDVYDLDRIWFYPPPSGDFGDMREKGEGLVKEWRESLDFSEEAHKESIQRIIDYAPKANISKSLRAKVRKLNKEFDFLYNG